MHLSTVPLVIVLSLVCLLSRVCAQQPQVTPFAQMTQPMQSQYFPQPMMQQEWQLPSAFSNNGLSLEQWQEIQRQQAAALNLPTNPLTQQLQIPQITSSAAVNPVIPQIPQVAASTAVPQFPQTVTTTTVPPPQNQFNTPQVPTTAPATSLPTMPASVTVTAPMISDPSVQLIISPATPAIVPSSQPIVPIANSAANALPSNPTISASISTPLIAAGASTIPSPVVSDNEAPSGILHSMLSLFRSPQFNKKKGPFGPGGPGGPGGIFGPGGIGGPFGPGGIGKKF
jgi:hypothetical protein